MAEYSRAARGRFVNNASTVGNAIINLPFQPSRVQFQNYTLANTNATSQNVVAGSWDVNMGQGQAIIQGYNATPTLIYDVVSTNGISTFSAGQLLQYGPLISLGSANGAGIAKTSATVLTVTVNQANAVVPGQWVVFQNLYQSTTTGMQQLAGIPFQVQATNYSAGPTVTVFQIAWVGNSSNLTAITTAATGLSGNLPGFKVILYPTLYDAGVAYPFAITETGGVGTVTTTAPHNFEAGQEIAFRIPATYGAQNLDSLPNILIPGAPNYFYVASVPTATSFTFNSPTLSSAFSVNQTFTSVPGLSFAQVLAVGNVNTGGTPYSGGNLYPSPLVFGNSLTSASTINGPAIRGAYINNTSQGFIIGTGAGRVLTTSVLVGAVSNVIYWQAFRDDIAIS